jgi:hypothetical protein
MGVAGFRTAAERTSADDGSAACSFVHLHATPRKPMRQLLKNTFTLVLALVFTAGMAFGQNNSATVNNVGDDHTNLINQQGADNTTDLEQVDAKPDDGVTNAHSADIFQKFDGNEAYVDQSGKFPGGNSGPVSFATADVDQIGNNNFLDLDQGTNYNTHTADIDQLGNNNLIRLQSQGGFSDGGTANVYMDGNQNKLVRANESGNLVSNKYAVQKNGQFLDVEITGDGNKVGAMQQNGNGGASLTIDIYGSGNFVPTWQDDNANGDNEISIVANGSDNFIKAIQDGGDNTTTITLKATSSYNDVRANQQSANNTANITIDGMNNQSIVCQNSTCN